MNTKDRSILLNSFRFGWLCSIPFILHSAALAVTATDDDLRPNPVNADQTQFISESTLIVNDVGNNKAIKSVDGTSTQGAAISWNSVTKQVSVDPAGIQSFIALDSGESADDQFDYTLEGEGDDDSATVQIRFNGVNDRPTLSGTTGTFNANDNISTYTPLINVTIGDPDVEDVTVTVTIDSTKGDFSNFSTLGFSNSIAGNDYVYSFTGSIANAQAKVRALNFVPVENLASVNNSTNLLVEIKVMDEALEVVNNKTISILSINDSPVVDVPASNLSMDDNGTLAIFAAVSISDLDPADDQNVEITYDDRKGSFPDSSTSQYTKSGANAAAKIVISNKSVTAANSILQNLIFTPKENQVASGLSEELTFVIETTDESQGNAVGTVRVDVTSVNDSPVISGNGSSLALNAAAGSPVLPFSNVTIADSDTQESSTVDENVGGNFTADVVLSRDTSGSFGSIVSSSFALKEATSDTYTFTSSLGVVEQAVRALKYIAPGDSATMSLSLTVRESPTTVSNSYTVTVTASVSNPGISGIATDQTCLDNQSILPFADAIFNSFGSAQRVIEITLDNDQKGSFDILGGFQYINDGILAVPLYRLSADAVEATQALQNIRFNPTRNIITGGSQTVEFTIKVYGQVGGSALSTDIVSITVESVNDSPGISSDSPTYRINDNESALPYQSIEVRDLDEYGQDEVTVTLSLEGDTNIAGVPGILTLTSSNDSYSLKDFEGQIVIDPSLYAENGQLLTIGNFVFTHDSTNNNILFDSFIVTPADVDVADFASLSLSFDNDFDPDGDTNTADKISILSFFNSQGSAVAKDSFIEELEGLEFSQFIGSSSELNELLNIVSYVPTQNRNQDGDRETVILTLHVADGDDGVAQVSDINVVVLSVDGSPVISGVPERSLQPSSVPAIVSVSSLSESFPFSSITVSDDINEAGPELVTIEISLDNPAKGTLSGGGFIETESDSGVYTLSDTVNGVNSALSALKYQLSDSYNFSLAAPGQTEFTIIVTDSSPAANQTREIYEIVVREPVLARVVTLSTDYSSNDAPIAGTLRKAIEDANNNDHILFDFPDDAHPVTIRLEEPLVIEKNINIIGPHARSLILSGDTDEDGNPDVQLITVKAGAALSLKQLTLKHGTSASYGGAVSVTEGASLSATYVSFEDNNAGQYGGAIDVYLGSLEVDQCLFYRNQVIGSTASSGGAISVYTTEDCSITNSTIAQNEQGNEGGIGGGGIYAEVSDVSRSLDLLVEHCTFINNVDAAFSGSAILSASSGTLVTLRNNLLVDEQGTVLDLVGGGLFQTLGGNIASDDTATTYTLGGGSRQNIIILSDIGDQTSTDPLLLSLADNQGPTLTCALGVGSPAKGNAVTPTIVSETLMTDQRGVWRGASRDSGAFQSGSFKRINLNEIFLERGSQFLEFYNPRESETLDMQNTKLYVDGTLIHSFDVSQTVEPGSGFVLNQVDWLPDFELNTEAGTIILQTAGNQVLMEVNYVANFDFGGVSVPSEIEVSGQSITRYPNFEGPYLPHRRVIQRATGILIDNGGLSSPGEDVNGALLNGGNAPPFALEDEEGLSLLAGQTLLIDVLQNDVEFDRTDTLQITEIMPVSAGEVLSTELDLYDDTEIGFYRLTGLSPDTTFDPIETSVTVSGDPNQLLYDTSASALMIALPEGGTVVDVWAYTIQDYDSHGQAYDRDPSESDNAKREENLKRATSYFYVTVNGVNDAPVVGEDLHVTTENQSIRLLSDATLIGQPFDFGDLDSDYMDFDASGAAVALVPTLQSSSLLSNDEDVDSDDTNATIELINVHTTSTQEGSTTATSLLGASVVLDIRANRSETSIIYDPRGSAVLNAMSAGDTPMEDSFYYSVTDRHGAIGTGKVTVLVSGINDIPSATDDVNFKASEDQVFAINKSVLLSNDTDPDQDGTDVTDSPDILSVPSSTTLGAVLSFDGTTITFDPTTLAYFENMARNEVVTDSFTYEISDGNGGSSSATVYIDFVGVNDRPSSFDDTLSIDENASVSVQSPGLLSNDVEIDVNGSVPDDEIWVLAQRGAITPMGASLEIETDGSYSYDANSALIESLYEGEQVVEDLLYEITDNSRTSASDDNFKTERNQVDVTLPVLVNDSVAGSAPSVISNYSEDAGTVVIESADHQLRNGLLVQVAGYEGTSDYNGVHAVTVIDRDRFSIPVTYIDNPESSRGTWRKWFTITAVGTPDQEGKLEIAADGQTLVYTPKVNFYGKEAFSYTIEDGVGGQDVATVEMTVVHAPLNSELVVKADRFVIYDNQPGQRVDVLTNDNMLPALGSELTITGTTAVGASTGTLSIAESGKSLLYEPQGLGIQEFTYTVSGGGTSSAQASVIFEVIAAEMFLIDSDSLEIGSPAGFSEAGENFVVVKDSTGNLFNVLGNDSVASSYPVSVELVEVVAAASSGTAEVINGQVRYTPNASYTGSDSFTYRVRDELGSELVKVVNVSVVEDSNEFYAVEDHYILWAGSTNISLPVLANDLATGTNSTSLSITNLGLDTQAPPESHRVSFDSTRILYSAPATGTTEIFTYEIGDGGSDRREAAIVITVIENYPQLNPVEDVFCVAKNSSNHSLDVLLNDSALPLVGWARTLTAVSSTSHGGSVSINNGTTIDYSPADDFSGLESFTYTVEDTFGQSASATVVVQVGQYLAGDDQFVVLANTQDNVFSVLVNDDLLNRYESTYKITEVMKADPNDQTVTITISQDVANNHLLYTPAAGFVGEDSFTYKVSDENGNIAEASVTVQVIAENSDRDSAFLRVTLTGVNDLPVLSGVSDGAITDKESIQPFESVTITDVDSSGNELQTVSVSFDSSLGTLTAAGFSAIHPNIRQITGTPAEVTAALRAISYRPQENQIDYINPGFMDHSLGLSIDDGYVQSPVTGTAVIRITPVNDAPVVGEDLHVTTENQSIRLLSDATLIGQPFDFGDLDSDYMDFDASGAAVALVPTLQSSSLLSNDEDVDSDDTNATIELINVHTTSTQEGSTTATSLLGASVVLDIRANRSETSIIYDPRGSAVLNAMSAGDTPMEDSFYYSVTDRHGAIGTGKVTVLVSGINDIPSATDDVNFKASEDQVFAINKSVLLSNDTDPDQDGTDVTDSPDILSVPSSTTLGAVLSFDGTTITFDPTTLAYFENMARNEVVTDSFTYEISDGNGGSSSATVYIDFVGVNDRPSSFDDTLSIDENASVSVQSPGLLSNDVEIDVNGSVPDDEIWVLAQRGAITPMGASLEIETDGSYSYDANSALIESLYEGEQVVEDLLYEITDNSRTSASDDNFKTERNQVDVTLPVLVNDSVAGSAPSVISNYSEDAGTVVIESADHQLRNGLLVQVAGYEGTSDYNGVHAVTVIDRDRFSIPVTYIDNPESSRGTWRKWFTITAVGTPDQEGKLEIAADGQTLVYTPKVNFYGKEAFSYTIEDGVGGQDVATVEMTVVHAPLNSELVVKADRFVIYDNQPGQRVDVLTNDNMLPALGSELTITGTTAVGASTGTLSIAESGKSLLYEPQGLGIQEFTYTVSGGGTSSAQASVIFEVIAAEMFLIDSDSLEIGSPAGFSEAGENFVVVKDSTGNLFNVLGNDSVASSYPVSVELVEVVAAASSGTAEVINGQVRYTPNASYTGSDSFTYRVRDELGSELVKVVNVSVVEDSNEFYAVEDHYILWAGSTNISLPVLANDLATGTNSTSLSITNLGLDTQAPPESHRVSFDSTRILYSAPATGTTEIFTYEIGDGGSDRREAAIVITVIENYPQLNPVEDVFCVAKNSSNHSLDVLLNDSALPLVGWARTLTAVSSTSHGGSVSINNGTTIDYSPADDFSGLESFTYTVEDTFGQSASATVVVQVGQYLAGDDQFVVLANTQDNVFSVLVNDDLLNRYESTYKITEVMKADPNDQTVTITISQDVANNHLLYTPAAGFVGEDSFTYKVSDENGNIAEASVTVQVIAENSDRDSAFLRVTLTGVNDLPVLSGVSDGAITDKESIQPFESVTITDVDSSGNELQTVSVSFDSSLGTLTAAGFSAIHPNIRQITGTPAEVTAALRAISYRPQENQIDYINPGFMDHSLGLSIDDGYVQSPVTGTAVIRITPVNDAPTLVQEIPDMNLGVNELTRAIYLPPYFADVDDAISAGQLTWSITATTNSALTRSLTIDQSKQIIVIDLAQDAFGVTDITIRGTDRGGLSVEDTFQLNVDGPPVIALKIGKSKPDAASYVSGTQYGFRRDYVQSFRVTNEGVLTAEAFVVHITALNQPVEGIVVQKGEYSTDERGTPDSFKDDLRSDERVTILGKEPYYYAVKYDTPLDSGESIVVHLTYRVATVDVVAIHPNIRIELTTASSDVSEAVGAGSFVMRNGLTGDMHLSFSVDAGAEYSLQYSSNLTDWSTWDAALPVSDFDRVIHLVDDGLNVETHPSLVGQRFYRIVKTTTP